MFQHYAPFKHMNVYDNVAFGLRVRKAGKAETKAKVDELLHLVHLEKFATRFPAQLSGGQRQRMALARALAVEPRVLLLDEPFGALDAQVRKELRVWLRRLHDEMHVTTVIVTHDQEEAMEVADEVVVLQDGRVQQTGSPTEIYEHPANDWVMGFLGPVTHFGDRLVRPHDLDLHQLADRWYAARDRRQGHQARLPDAGRSRRRGHAGLCPAGPRGDGSDRSRTRQPGARAARPRRRLSVGGFTARS